MGYIGNNSISNQIVQPATDFFSGNGVTTSFTLTRPLVSAYTIEAVVNNVQQNPATAYTVTGNVITFTSAPSAGTNNVYINYNSVVGAQVAIGQGTISQQQLQILSVGNSQLIPGSVSSSTIAAGAASATALDSGNLNGTGAVTLPNGTTAQRPTATTSQFRFNTTTGSGEYSVNGFWINEQNGYTQILGKTKSSFVYSGADQTFSVPGGVTYIFVKMWGAGGGAGSYGGWRQGATGGAGGYSEAIVPVVPGQTIIIRVGGRGYARPGAATAWPNGGGASTAAGDNQYTGNGGASSSIVVPTLNSGAPCMFAGGGGGGASVNGWGRTPGGAGGGLQGEDAYPELTSYLPYAYVGRGGTQSSGGVAVSGASTTGGAGSYNQGGTHQNANCYGGGGGGGYYGGSSGCYSGAMGGGGGGSGFVHSSLIRAQTLTGVREYPPMYSDPDAVASSLGTSYRVGVGGDEGAQGGHGLVVFYY